jgi:hypothetical protein
MNNDSMEIYKGIIQSYADLSLLALYTLQELLEGEIKMRQQSFNIVVASVSDEQVVGNGIEKKSHLSLVKG